MWSMGIILFVALIILFMGLYLPGLSWMIIVAAALVVVSLISGFVRARELA